MNHRILSLALCLLIIFYLPACTPSTTPQNDIDFSAQVIRTDEINAPAPGNFPDCLAIRSYDALQNYYTEYQAQFQLTQLSRACDSNATDFSTAITQYSPSWFEIHDLLLVRVRGTSGSATLQISSVTHKSSPAQWSISVKEILPDTASADTAFWHILITVDKCECSSHSVTVVMR